MTWSTPSGQLADSDIARRNRLRAWESRLQTVAQRFDHDAEGAGRQARVDALREARSTALRDGASRKPSGASRCAARSSRPGSSCPTSPATAARRCAANCKRKPPRCRGAQMAGFEGLTRGRAEQVVAEVSEGTDTHLADVAEVMGVPLALPAARAAAVPMVDVSPPPLKSRRQETVLMMLLGAGFGLGVGLTLSRTAGRSGPDRNPGLEVAGAVACVAVGLALTFAVVTLRGLLRDRALLDRWAGEATASLRSVVEELVATRVLLAESVLTTALAGTRRGRERAGGRPGQCDRHRTARIRQRGGAGRGGA